MQRQDELHPEDKRNLIIFVVASLIIWFTFDHMVLKPRLEQAEAAREAAVARAEEAAMSPGAVDSTDTIRDRAVVIAESPRVKIDNGSVFGSLSLKGGRLDDLSLQRYFKTLAKTDHVVLLAPAGTDHPRYADLGWVASDSNIKLPGKDTLWRQTAGSMLAEGKPVTLAWENGQGLRFENEFTIDANYMVTVTQRVKNNSGRAVTLFPYALVAQQGMAEDYEGKAIVHEGPLAYLDGELIERSFRKADDKPMEEFKASTGWVGLSEKYWFTSVIPEQSAQKTYRFVYTPPRSETTGARYQTDVTGAAQTVEPGATTQTTTHIFAGAKEIKLLEQYEQSLPVHHFDLAVDFGLYYFLTKPFFYILDFFGRVSGNFGIAIICLTIIVRLAVFPLANTSFKSFAQMKKIGPQMKELRDKYGDEREKLQSELVKLYEREKVNPMAGCLPLLIQIPIFFALYKTLMVTIEMRHAPFMGWIHDLSDRDPTSVFNLFGLIPWTPPEFLMIGGWSCLMFLAMMAQKYLNPPPQDPTQAMVQRIMPFLITYILSQFAAGLVIYWTFSNTLSVIQQYIIMRSLGVEVHFFKRSKEDKEMEEAVSHGPSVHPALGVIEDKVEEALHSGDAEPKKISAPKPKKSKKKK